VQLGRPVNKPLMIRLIDECIDACRARCLWVPKIVIRRVNDLKRAVQRGDTGPITPADGNPLPSAEEIQHRQRYAQFARAMYVERPNWGA
jgi:hypothetical protein